MARPFPILFITANRIGDAVLSSGLLRRLHEEAPESRFTVVAGPLAAPLFRDTPNLDEIIVLEKRRFAGHWYDLWRRVRGRRWGLVLDRRGSGLSRFLSAKRRAVFHKGRSGAEHEHKVVESARLLKLAEDPPAPFLHVSPETQAYADAWLDPAYFKSDGPVLAIAPAANWTGKTWPPERYALVAKALLAPGGALHGARVVILGAAEDRRAAEPIRRSLPKERWLDLTGEVDLLTAYAILKRCRLFIGADSGLMHLAAAAGCPTLGLFGPSDERLYAPWGPDTATVRGPRSFEQIKAVDPALNQPVCHMLDLPVDKVTAAAAALVARTAPRFGAAA